MAARKKRKACPSCGSPFQVGKIVYRAMPEGFVRQRVCQPCAGLAVPVLASDTPARCEECGTVLARFCGGCVAKILAKSRGVRVLAEAGLMPKTKVVAGHQRVQAAVEAGLQPFETLLAQDSGQT